MSCKNLKSRKRKSPQKRRMGGGLDDLPYELQHKISMRLSPRTVQSLAQTNKRQNALVKAPQWVILQTANLTPLEKNIFLLKAAANGDVHRVQGFLKTYNPTTEIKNKALFLAAKYKKVAIVKILIEQGVHRWDLGLLGAAEGGNKELVSLFMQKGADVNAGLCGASKGGKIGLVKLFRDAGANDINGALEKAAVGGNIALVKYFINAGANNFDNALTFALLGGNQDIIQSLISYMSDTIPGFQFDISAGMILLAIGGHTQLVKQFISEITRQVGINGVDVDEGLRGSAGGGHLDLVKLFVEMGATDFADAIKLTKVLNVNNIGNRDVLDNYPKIIKYLQNV